MVVNHKFALNNKGFSNTTELSGLARHRWYCYKEGFSPSLVEHALEAVEFDKKKHRILDPFNGSGTVTLFSAVNGYQSTGFEVNPFSSFIARSKETVLSKKALEHFSQERDCLVKAVKKGRTSSLKGFSTFTESRSLDKWLFNTPVINSFEAGKRYLNNLSNQGLKQIFKLALINSAMENCNAKRDGKCLRYKTDWEDLSYNSESFIEALEDNLAFYYHDLTSSEIKNKSVINCGDSRKLISRLDAKFKICITSPPYLNSFDYTDVYRPELFLGEFLTSQNGFNSLKHRTFRSHISILKTENPKKSFGKIYDGVYEELTSSTEQLWSSKIPFMVESYFTDMSAVIKMLKQKALKGSELWIVVANSAYANIEIPTDLIIAEIGAKAGWFLKEIGVLRYLHKRGTKYSPDIKNLRESVVIFSSEKF